MRHLPNAITLINVFCGSLAAVFVLQDRYDLAFISLLICFVADYADGLAARLTGSKTDVGLELDSLADAISFGFVPGCMLFQLLNGSNEMMYGNQLPSWTPYIAFIYTAAAVLRLARFNVDEDQVTYFKGMPTPAAAAGVFGLMIIDWLRAPYFRELSSNAFLLLLITLILALLMNMQARVFSFKLESFSWKGNELRYLTLFGALILLIFFKEAALVPAIGLYVLLSLLTHYKILPFENNYNINTHAIPGQD